MLKSIKIQGWSVNGWSWLCLSCNSPYFFFFNSWNTSTQKKSGLHPIYSVGRIPGLLCWLWGLGEGDLGKYHLWLLWCCLWEHACSLEGLPWVVHIPTWWQWLRTSLPTTLPSCLPWLTIHLTVFPLLLLIKAGCDWAPHLSCEAAVWDAAVTGLSTKDEGEDTSWIICTEQSSWAA